MYKMRQNIFHKALAAVLTIVALAVGQNALAQATFPVNVTFQGLMNNGKYSYVITSGLHIPYNPEPQNLSYSNYVRFNEQEFDIGSNDVPLTMTVDGDFSFPATIGDATVHGQYAHLVFTSGLKYITAVSVSTYGGTPVSVESITGTNFVRDVLMTTNTTFGKVTLTMATHTPLDYGATIGGIEDTYLDDGVNQPVPTVTYQEDSNSTPITLTEGVDYTVSYNVGSKTGEVIVTGMGQYIGSTSMRYNIRQLSLSEDFNKLGDGIYEIATKQDLDNLAKLVGNGNHCKDVTFRQTADIAYSYQYAWDNISDDIAYTENNYTAIGGYGQSFQGHFDGQGHTISGIRIRKNYALDGDYAGSQGLFGYLGTGGTVENVIVKDAMIDAYTNVGGIVGFNSGTVSNCIAYHVRVFKRSEMLNVTTGRGPITGHNGGTVTSCYYRDCAAARASSTNMYNYRYDNVFALTLADGVTASGERVTIDGTTYYAYDTDITLAYSGGRETFTMPAMDVIPLLNGYDNTAFIAAHNGETDNVILTGRTLYKDGAWNTLCLPFDLTLSESVFDGADARALDNATFSNGTLTLNFSDPVDELVAGKPYIIKWQGGNHITSPVFNGVFISKATNDFISADGKVEFKCTYAPINFDTADKSILFMGAVNKLYYPGAGASIGAFRAYFKINFGGDEVKRFVLNFEDDATSLNEELRMKNEESAAAKGWYNLDGRKLNGKPSQKGIYINNGKKQLINN